MRKNSKNLKAKILHHAQPNFYCMPLDDVAAKRNHPTNVVHRMKTRPTNAIDRMKTLPCGLLLIVQRRTQRNFSERRARLVIPGAARHSAPRHNHYMIFESVEMCKKKIP